MVCHLSVHFFFFKQKTAYEMRISDWSSDVCSSDLVILMLAPETNGEVAVKAWEALSQNTGRDHKHLALPKEEEKIRFRDIQAQPRKIISSPTWSGIESEHVCYNAGYTNVHELIPWRTLTGRQQLYQDHKWMRAFGEGFCVYRSEEHTSELQSLMRISYAVFCLKKKTKKMYKQRDTHSPIY